MRHVCERHRRQIFLAVCSHLNFDQVVQRYVFGQLITVVGSVFTGEFVKFIAISIPSVVAMKATSSTHVNDFHRKELCRADDRPIAPPDGFWRKHCLPRLATRCPRTSDIERHGWSFLYSWWGGCPTKFVFCHTNCMARHTDFQWIFKFSDFKMFTVTQSCAMMPEFKVYRH